MLHVFKRTSGFLSVSKSICSGACLATASWGSEHRDGKLVLGGSLVSSRSYPWGSSEQIRSLLQDSSSQMWWLMDPPRSCPHGVEHSQFLSLFRMGCGFVPHRPGPCPWRPQPVARGEPGAATGADGVLVASVLPHCLLSGKD